MFHILLIKSCSVFNKRFTKIVLVGLKYIAWSSLEPKFQIHKPENNNRLVVIALAICLVWNYNILFKYIYTDKCHAGVVQDEL